MKSMTGFGRGDSFHDGLVCTVEIKSVNARFLDMSVRSQKQINFLDHVVRDIIKNSIHRGKVEVTLSLSDTGNREKRFNVNSVLKEQIQALLVEEGFYDNPEDVPLGAVMSVSGDWIQMQDAEISESVLYNMVEEATANAVEQLVRMRDIEGRHLQIDLLERADAITDILTAVDAGKDKAVDTYRQHLKGKIKEYLLSLDANISEDRFIQEIALLADKTDITEEIVRFRSHVVQLKNTLMETDSVGRKLDFIIQEMNREVNTIGSKSMDSYITDCVVQLKCELEKIREQVQNIE